MVVPLPSGFLRHFATFQSGGRLEDSARTTHGWRDVVSALFPGLHSAMAVKSACPRRPIQQCHPSNRRVSKDWDLHKYNKYPTSESYLVASHGFTDVQIGSCTSCNGLAWLNHLGAISSVGQFVLHSLLAKSEQHNLCCWDDPTSIYPCWRIVGHVSLLSTGAQRFHLLDPY